jgi:chemotaxis methyl-accepting protein methylase/signal transduction histidine kinase/chemotaxis response regulator CheB
MMKAALTKVKLVPKGKKKPYPKLERKEFTIVAIGASVGGLEAITNLLNYLPADTGMAYIYVQHLNPEHKSILTSILAKKTKMKVQEIENMELISPNNLYVIPNNKIIEVIDGHIKLIPRPNNSSAISIDILFESLATTHKENVIGIILSGNASDGTNGMIAIKNAGGLTFAQDYTAQASSMPHSAIAAGVVDFVLSPKKMALKLVDYVAGDFRLDKNQFQLSTVKKKSADINSIFELLLKESGVDFSHYKLPTIKRRLNHKMLQSGAKTIKEYVQLLHKKNNGIELLYQDLLINVTDFFRDIKVFNFLKTSLLPKIIKNKTIDDTIRIWIPACSTGEEAYSIGMLLIELQSQLQTKIPVQIFATDLSEEVIRFARMGIYSPNDVKQIPKGQLDRFFTKIDDQYHVVKELRKMCVFAPHNILLDPPFSRMDFVSCCNLLIYLDSAAQKKVFSSIHFALNETGYLLLGKAETIGASSQLFTQINSKYKIFSRKKNGGVSKILELTNGFSKSNMALKRNLPISKSSSITPVGIENAIDSVLLQNYMPACAVVNKELEILQFRGPISFFLKHASGKASLNILKMAHPEFVFELRTAIQESIKFKCLVKKSGIEFKVDEQMRLMTFEVSPLKIEWDEPLLLIVFMLHEAVEKTPMDQHFSVSLKDKKILKLTEELKTTRIEMNAVIETQENTYEELQGANEEIVSSNEEFQTLNEELETSKEEIEATNEELITGNLELQTRNDLLTESYEYSEAIIATIHEPMLVLDKNLHVKSANKSFYKKFQVRKEDTEGRLIFDLGNKQWNIPKLREVFTDILTKSKSFENFEVTHVFSSIGEKIMQLNAHLIIQKVKKEKLILLAIVDVTKQKLIKRQLIEAKKIAEEAKIEAEKLTKTAELALNAKQQFLSNMSHEIRTPLNAIIGFTKVVLKTELSLKQQEYLAAIKISGDTLITLINDILDFAKVDAGKMIFEQTPFKLKDSVAAMVHLFETKIREKNIDLIQEFDVKIPELVIGDSIRLNQIIMNLMSNAVKFTCKGSISIFVSLVKETKHKIVVEFSISDTGIGIPVDKMTTIFENFQQVSSDTSRLYGGTGLGLAIVKQLVERQEGTIKVKSKIGEGSNFCFTLPFLKPNSKTSNLLTENVIPEIIESDINHIKVLVVEDISLNQLLMKTILDDFGFERDIASNGKIAIEFLQNNSYDIILMDLQMPEMNGFEASEYIRTKMNSKIPIIALTADVTTVDLAKCKAVGLNDYIAKPIDEKILYDKIIELVKKPS